MNAHSTKSPHDTRPGPHQQAAQSELPLLIRHGVLSVDGAVVLSHCLHSDALLWLPVQGRDRAVATGVTRGETEPDAPAVFRSTQRVSGKAACIYQQLPVQNDSAENCAPRDPRDSGLAVSPANGAKLEPARRMPINC